MDGEEMTDNPVEYEIREVGDEFEVVNKETGAVADTFGSRDDAKRFVKLLEKLQEEGEEEIDG